MDSPTLLSSDRSIIITDEIKPNSDVFSTAGKCQALFVKATSTEEEHEEEEQ